MKNIFKGLVFGFLTLALVVGVGAMSANAALTLGALTIASDGALTLTGAVASNADFASTTTTGALTLGGALTTGSLTIGNFSGTTENVIIYGGASSTNNNLFTNVTTGQINIGAVNTGGINIGYGFSNQAITIGSTNGTSALNLLAGTNNINFTGHLISKDTAPTITESGVGAVTVMASNTDSAGWLRTSTTAHTSVIITFARPYNVAPHCTFSPSNAAAALLQLTSPGVYGTSTTTALTLTHASSITVADWEYVCVGAE